jgi:hypothetical protein
MRGSNIKALVLAEHSRIFSPVAMTKQSHGRKNYLAAVRELPSRGAISWKSSTTGMDAPQPS